MKLFKRFMTFPLLAFLICTIAACEKNYSIESVVHTDGSIDRTITVIDADSGKLVDNIFGINETAGWDARMEQIEPLEKKATDSAGKENKFNVIFHRKFASVDDANNAMAGRDTLFNIQSDFEKSFRWFYTYIRYSDTYGAINRFRDVPTSDYFTSEDYAFIDRLPAEGKPISKADSLFLARLEEKVMEHFAARTFYEEYYKALTGALEKNADGRLWVDTLAKHKEGIFHRLVEKSDDFDDDFMLAIADSMHIPLSQPVKDEYWATAERIERMMNFMSDMDAGKYVHAISMPWSVVDTNADSVSGKRLFWKPPVIRFLLNDYTMYAESRTLNSWAVAISGVILLVTVAIFIRNRRNARTRREHV